MASVETFQLNHLVEVYIFSQQSTTLVKLLNVFSIFVFFAAKNEIKHEKSVSFVMLALVLNTKLTLHQN